jgi:hypothetical protein
MSFRCSSVRTVAADGGEELAMGAHGKLPRDLKVVLGGVVLYFIFSFLDWQQLSLFGFTAGQTEWSGIGVVAGLLAVALFAWEVVRDFVQYGRMATLSQAVTSLLFALLLAVFTVIAFLNKGLFRHWPAWGGLIISLVIAAAALVRARREIPFGKLTSTGRSSE